MIQRVRPADVTPLEIWDHDAGDGRRLVDRVGAERAAALEDDALAAELLAVLDALALAHARTRAERVFLGGGLVDRAGVRAALAAARRPYGLVLASSGRFVAEPGGLALLRDRGHAGGVVVDVGQTAIKVSAPGGTRRVVERAPGPFVPWLRAAIPPAAAVVLGLPCEIDDRGALGACTYPDVAIPDLGVPTYVLNDAELAALSAPPLPGRTLVVTLGFGPGAAVISRRAR
jgi:hypothetical protein